LSGIEARGIDDIQWPRGHRHLRNHEGLILNGFQARGMIPAGMAEGLNNKVKLTTTRAYGFRTFDAVKTAMYPNLGKLPEPECTHRFCGRA
jgi:hypothetical protein